MRASRVRPGGFVAALGMTVARLLVSCGSESGTGDAAERSDEDTDAGAATTADTGARATAIDADALADASADSESETGDADAGSRLDAYADVSADAGGFGSLYLFSQTIAESAGPRGVFDLQAYFGRAGFGAGASRSSCDFSGVVGDCRGYTCVPADGGGAAPDPTPPPHAGRIDVTGAALGSSGVLVPGHDLRYPRVNESRAVFAGGENIRFHWQGSADPRVGPPPGELHVPAPHRPTITTPFADGMTIARDTDMRIDWSNPPGQTYLAKIGVLVSRATSNGHYSAVSCDFEALAGTGTVPKALLEKLTPGEGLYQISITAQGRVILPPSWHMSASVTTTSVSNRGISGVAALFQ